MYLLSACCVGKGHVRALHTTHRLYVQLLHTGNANAEVRELFVGAYADMTHVTHVRKKQVVYAFSQMSHFTITQQCTSFAHLHTRRHRMPIT